MGALADRADQSFRRYEHTFPKGGLEKGMSAQANAIKETYEEAGLKVEITGYVGDFERTTSVARYYTAKRVGGSPADHGTESQSVKLVPKADLRNTRTIRQTPRSCRSTWASPRPPSAPRRRNSPRRADGISKSAHRLARPSAGNGSPTASAASARACR
jgi:ADP-ribose pyrophosphatase YjhB (NUDIX family)